MGGGGAMYDKGSERWKSHVPHTYHIIISTIIMSWHHGTTFIIISEFTATLR